MNSLNNYLNQECPACQQMLEIDRSYIGKLLKCPNCKRNISIKENQGIAHLPNRNEKNIVTTQKSTKTVHIPRKPNKNIQTTKNNQKTSDTKKVRQTYKKNIWLNPGFALTTLVTSIPALYLTGGLIATKNGMASDSAYSIALSGIFPSFLFCTVTSLFAATLIALYLRWINESGFKTPFKKIFSILLYGFSTFYFITTLATFGKYLIKNNNSERHDLNNDNLTNRLFIEKNARDLSSIEISKLEGTGYEKYVGNSRVPEKYVIRLYNGNSEVHLSEVSIFLTIIYRNYDSDSKQYKTSVTIPPLSSGSAELEIMAKPGFINADWIIHSAKGIPVY